MAENMEIVKLPNEIIFKIIRIKIFEEKKEYYNKKLNYTLKHLFINWAFLVEYETEEGAMFEEELLNGTYSPVNSLFYFVKEKENETMNFIHRTYNNENYNGNKEALKYVKYWNGESTY